MSYMQAQVTEKMEWLSIDGPQGSESVAVEDVGAEAARALVREVRRAFLDSGSRNARVQIPHDLEMYFENREVFDAAIVRGYGVRSSAPGYMDATPWVVYTSLREAKKAYTEEKRLTR